jgi:hypothetical protein
MKESRPFGGRLVSSTLEGVSTLTRDRYIVVFHEGDWKIRRSGGLSARYRTQQEAVLDALHSARKASRRGEAVQVLLEGYIDPITFS